MVEQEPVVAELYDTVVVGPAADRAEDAAFILVRPEGIVGHRIDDFRLVSSEGAVAVGQIVFPVMLVDPGGLEEFHKAFYDMDFAVIRNHVVIQFDAAAGILAHEHIGLPVIVNEHARVDEIAVTDHPRGIDGQEGMSQRIFERTCGAVGHGHADVLHIRRIIEVVFPVPFHAVRRPGVLRGPGRLLERTEYHAAVFERLHVPSHVNVIILHVESLCRVPVVTWIHIQGIPEHARRRIRRIHMCDNGISAQFIVTVFRSAGRHQNNGGKQECVSSHFHDNKDNTRFAHSFPVSSFASCAFAITLPPVGFAAFPSGDS